jgi:hypothetical protein
MEIKNDGNVEKQVNISENNGSIYLGKPRRLSSWFEKLNAEVSNNSKYEVVLDELERYITKKDSIGLVRKLEDGGFTKSDIQRANEKKQAYWKKLEKNKMFEYAQRIDIDLLAKIKIDFEVHIEPLIIAGENKDVIMKAVLKDVVNPILNILNEDGAADNVLYYNTEDVFGMIYFLTGKCHLNWTNYDNI